MFKEIHFHYDSKGRFLGNINRRGTITSNPRVLEATQVNSVYFYLSDATFRRSYGESRAIYIHRKIGKSKDLKNDPWNEDGRPPTLMSIIVNPVIEYCCGVVEIEGLEAPNLCWAGCPMEPYEGCPRQEGVKYLDRDDIDRFRPYEQLNRQRVMLIPNRDED